MRVQDWIITCSQHPVAILGPDYLQARSEPRGRRFFATQFLEIFSMSSDQRLGGLSRPSVSFLHSGIFFVHLPSRSRAICPFHLHFSFVMRSITSFTRDQLYFLLCLSPLGQALNIPFFFGCLLAVILLYW